MSALEADSSVGGGSPIEASRAAESTRSVTQQHKAQFSDLPAEIRFQIWKYAVPRNRTIRVHLDFKNSRAKTIGPFSRVPSILHICRDSRHTAMSFLRRGFGNRSPEDRHNNFYWCPEFDRIYFIPSKSWAALSRPLLSFQNAERVSAGLNEWLHFQRVVPEVQHLALPLNKWLLKGCEHVAYDEDRFMIRMLQNLPALKNVCFLLQPYDNWLGEYEWDSMLYRHYQVDSPPRQRAAPSTLVLYDCLDVPVYHMSFELPSQIERDIEKSFETYQQKEALDWDPPTVQLAMLGFKRFKGSGFCVPLQSNPESWTDDSLRLKTWGWSRLSQVDDLPSYRS